MVKLFPQKVESLLTYLGDVDLIFRVSKGDLRSIPQLTSKDVDTIMRARGSDCLDKELKLIKRQSITVIDIFDDRYPPLLKEISHPPLLLYIMGQVDVLTKTLFAIVGSRLATRYGISLASEYGEFVYQLNLSEQEIFSENIKIEEVPIIKSVSPSTIASSVPTEFKISVDSSQNISSYEWDFGDNSTETTTTNKATHTYTKTGQYKLKIRTPWWRE